MRTFNVRLSVKLGSGRLFVLREVGPLAEVGHYAAPMEFKGIRYVDSCIHVELLSLQEFPAFLKVFKTDLFHAFDNVIEIARFIAAAAFDDNGELVESQPWMWSVGDPTATIEWDRHQPRVDGENLVFLGEYWVGDCGNNTHRIYEVSCNLVTFEVRRKELASYVLRLL
jgi:hypothetical protein